MPYTQLTFINLWKSRTKNPLPVRTIGSYEFDRTIDAMRRNGPPHKYHELRRNASPHREEWCFNVSPK